MAENIQYAQNEEIDLQNTTAESVQTVGDMDISEGNQEGEASEDEMDDDDLPFIDLLDDEDRISIVTGRLNARKDDISSYIAQAQLIVAQSEKSLSDVRIACEALHGEIQSERTIAEVKLRDAKEKSDGQRKLTGRVFNMQHHTILGPKAYPATVFVDDTCDDATEYRREEVAELREQDAKLKALVEELQAKEAAIAAAAAVAARRISSRPSRRRGGLGGKGVIWRPGADGSSRIEEE